MKNRQYNSDTSIYYITGTKHTSGVDIITMQYSQAGVLTAFDGYSNTVLARRAVVDIASNLMHYLEQLMKNTGLISAVQVQELIV